MLLDTVPPLRPSDSTIDRARSKLDAALGPSKVLTSRSQCEAYRTDDSDVSGPVPDLVVLARTTDDIARTLEIAQALGVPVTPRGAGTGRTGGAVPAAGGIVLVTLGMSAIKDIDKRNLTAVVEPGVTTGAIHAAVEAEGLFYPPDPNSLDQCAIGGNAAENAGGPRAFRYGVTREYVLGLDAVLMGGTRLQTGRRTVKGVTGYDVTALLVGSEGTLAVFSQLTLRLIPKPPEVMTLLALFTRARHAAEAVAAMTERRVWPRCLEFLDAGTLAAVRARGIPIDERAGAMLLIEVDGDAHACEVAAEQVGAVCTDQGALEVLVAQDAAQRARLWTARREMSPAVRALARHKIAEDVVVPRSRIPDLLDRIDASSETLGVRTVTYGHAGDGNLHVNFLWNHEDERFQVDRAVAQLFRDVIEFGGTLSGEHGIGLLKAPYLALEQSDALIALQKRLKQTFDPSGLLNPGKIFPSGGHRAC